MYLPPCAQCQKEVEIEIIVVQMKEITHHLLHRKNVEKKMWTKQAENHNTA